MSTKKLGFILDRSPTIKIYLPLILEALGRNIEVFVFCGPNPSNSWPQHPRYRPLAENMLFPKKDRVNFIYYQDNDHLMASTKDTGIDHLITSDFANLSYRPALPVVRKQGIKIHGLQWSGDYLSMTPETFETLDSYFIYTPQMIDFYKRQYPHSQLENKFVTSGNYMMDQIPELKESREQIYKKFNLHPRKKVVLFYTQDLHHPRQTFLIKNIFLQSNKVKSVLKCLSLGQFNFLRETRSAPRYHDLILAIRNWAHQNNAALIIKSRLKQEEPNFIPALADHFLTDSTEYYPYRSLELLAIADAVFSIFSTVTLEAVASDVPSINISFPHYLDPQSPTTIFFGEPDFFDFPGVVTSCLYRQLPKFLEEHSLNGLRVDPEKRKKYVEKYLGKDDHRASSRIINYLYVQPI